MGAAALKTPELVLDEKEAEALANSIAAVSAHYPVAINQKWVDWAHLLIAVGTIYGTRFVAVNSRLKKEKEIKAQTNEVNRPQTSIVTNLNDIPAMVRQ